MDAEEAYEIFQGPPPIAITQKEVERLFAPQPILPRTDVEFIQRYRTLKGAAWKWSEKYFSQDQAQLVTTLDLMRISEHTPELMEYVNTIASCGSQSWEDVFSKRITTLVYGIMGKAIEVHVFGQEMFGASENQIRSLRLLDLEMSKIDGIFFSSVHILPSTHLSQISHTFPEPIH